MGETFTTFFNVINNQDAMEKQLVNENLDADELLFYHAIRQDLDKLQMKPDPKTIQNILTYSKRPR